MKQIVMGLVVDNYDWPTMIELNMLPCSGTCLPYRLLLFATSKVTSNFLNCIVARLRENPHV